MRFKTSEYKLLHWGLHYREGSFGRRYKNSIEYGVLVIAGISNAGITCAEIISYLQFGLVY